MTIQAKGNYKITPINLAVNPEVSAMSIYDKTDNEIIAFALDMWGNYIETFSVHMSAKDAKAKTYKAGEYYEPNFMTGNQIKLVNRIRKLADSYKK